MRKIRISDMTMAQDTKAFSLSFREKIELGKLLDGLGTDVIELEPIRDGRTDALRVKSIAAAVKNSTVAVPVLPEQTAETVWSALKLAAHPRLQVCVPVSPVQMEYLYHKKAEAVLRAVTEQLTACRALCADVEFLADDATRAEPEFLAAVLAAAIDAGASSVTVCDAAGTMLPEEFAGFISGLYEAVPALGTVTLGVRCSDNLSMADACAIAAISRGAGEVKAAACPAGSASLANVARILSARSDSLGAATTVATNQLSRVMEQILWMCRTERRKTSPFDSGVRSDPGIFLTKHDDIAAVTKAAEQLGYELSDEDTPKVYDAFLQIAAKKEQVSIRELDAIVASAAMQVPPAYQLQTYVINAGNTISSSAHLRLSRDGQVLEGVCLGDGPIDAAFLAIERITGCHYELDDFQIQAVTEGREAMGQTIVRLRHKGKLYAGRGISTDIVGASIHAYLNALNKIVYEEAEA